MKLLKLSTIVLNISNFYVISITIGCLIAILFVMILNFNFVDLLLFGITWDTIWGFWCYNACIIAYYLPGYYFIVCYFLKLRLQSIEISLNSLKTNKKFASLKAKIITTRIILKDHNYICLQIKDYNKFWSKYLTVTYSIFILLVCFISFVVFISPIKWFARMEYSIVLSAHVLLILIITYSASTVSHFNFKITQNLFSICIQNDYPLNYKIKV